MSDVIYNILMDGYAVPNNEQIGCGTLIDEVHGNGWVLDGWLDALHVKQRSENMPNMFLPCYLTLFYGDRAELLVMRVPMAECTRLCVCERRD